MAQLSIQELEELIFARADLLTEKDSLQRENYKLKERLAIMQAVESPFQQSAADTAMKLQKMLDEAKEQLSAKDNEILHLSICLKEAHAVGEYPFEERRAHLAEIARLAAEIDRLAAEIDRLAAEIEPTIVRVTQIDRNKEAEAVKIVQDTVDALVLNPLADLPYVAQEQADEHPAKSGWVNLGVEDESMQWWQDRPNNNQWAYLLAGDYWAKEKHAIIAAYDRHIQKGGQAQ